MPCDESNLIAKAYRVFIDEYPDFAEKSGYACKVVKKIPTKAGLGGGSSDAAAALAVFSRLRAVPLSKERLQELAGRVGSDGPLFFEDGASVGRGRGELVEPIECPSLWLTVVKPVDGLSTAAVYGRYASSPSHGPQKSLDEFCAGVRRAAELARSALALSEEERTARLDSVRLEIAQTVARKIANRLEEPADAMWSGFERRRELLRSTGALGVQISGSGSALFAIYPDERSAKRAAEEARRVIEDPASDLRGDRVYAVRTLSSLVL
ncbi:MAG: 4-(cytidine 5'-diphospho)-2-C-methyl-D-erythritol kinase [Thermoguttaceae bacterium]|nr:4-(cytidine 5'-diphospho)-2-C-methyl-D-erythritol kinase [Thermoguttaceae bacterium]